MSGTRERLFADIKQAMKSGDKTRLATLRLVAAEIKQKEVDERITLDDHGIVTVLERMRKQRRESIRQFTDAGRDDLVAVEQAELDVIASYMPAPLTDADIEALVTEAIAVSQATSLRDMGKVMAQLKPSVQGRADMADVSHRVKQRLGGN